MRVVRGFAFLDLCQFTGFTAVEGDDNATRVLANFRMCLREIASRRAVRVAKWLGDGAMLVGVEPAPLVATVLELESRIDDGGSLLQIRVGMTMGPVILFEGDDYIGTTVNLASRLCDAAGPRQILAVPSLSAHVPPWGTVSAPGRVVVPGFPEPIDMMLISRRPAGAEAYTDPICRMTLPADSAVAWVDGTGFCSDSCAAAWGDGIRDGQNAAFDPVRRVEFDRGS